MAYHTTSLSYTTFEDVMMISFQCTLPRARPVRVVYVSRQIDVSGTPDLFIH